MRRIMALVSMGLVATSAAGQEAPKDPEVARLERETALLNARAARDTAAAAVTTARTAEVKARVDALGLPAPEGKTTLGTTGGMIESWMLSASTIDAAGSWIAREVRATPATPLGAYAPPAAPPGDRGRRVEAGSDGPPAPPVADAGPLERAGGRPAPEPGAGSVPPVLLVGGEEELVLDAAADVSGQVASAAAGLRAAVPAFCSARPEGGGDAGGAFPVAAVGAIAGLLRTDTEISGLDVPVPNRMLVAGVARRLVAAGVPVTLPAAAIAPATDGALTTAWGSLLAERDAARGCRPRFAAQGGTAWIKKKLAALDTAIAAVATLETRLTTPDDKGRIPLARAIRVDALLEGSPRVLRVTVEKGGGSLLKRSNLWTALGAPAVGITGGLIVSYTLTEPRGGGFLQGGALVCRTALTNLRDVQSGRVGGSRRARADCSPLLASD